MAKAKVYRVEGSVRGIVGEHVTLDAAIRTMQRDKRACARLGGGAYSDVRLVGLTPEAEREIARWERDNDGVD